MGFSSWRWLAVLSKSIQVFFSKNPSTQTSMSVTLEVFTTLKITCVSLALCSGWMALGWDWCSVESLKPQIRKRQSCVPADQHPVSTAQVSHSSSVQDTTGCLGYWLGFLVGFVCSLFQWFLEIHLCIKLGIVLFSPFFLRCLPVGKKTCLVCWHKYKIESGLHYVLTNLIPSGSENQ